MWLEILSKKLGKIVSWRIGSQKCKSHMIISDKDKKKRTFGGLRIFIGRDDSGNLVSLSKKGKIIHVTRGKFRQDVLALVDKVLLGGGEKIQDVKEIAVDRGPGGFSEVRGRIATAAALMTSLGISTALVHGMTAE